jgi:prepilin-type processing-associated H-X9-DG protein
VVFAIIGVLAGLLLPGLSRAKRAAEMAVCKSNLRQIGIGLQLCVDSFQAYLWRATWRRHDGRLNMSYCDGHVAGMRIPDAFDVLRDDVLKLWNNDHLPHHVLAWLLLT